MTLPQTGNYKGATLLIDEVDVSASVQNIEFLDLTDTLLNWEMVVRFKKEPDGLDTFNMLGKIYPLVFLPNDDGHPSVNQHALVSQWDVSSITLKPSKSKK